MHPQSRQRASRHAGFSLMELLVAAMMFAIVMSVLATVFFGSIRLRNTTDDVLRDDARISQALRYLERDLKAVTVPGDGLSGDLTTLADLNATSDSSQLEFYTASGLSSPYEPWGDLQRVNYFLREPLNLDRTNGLDLIRGVTRNLLPVAEEDYSEQVMLRGVDRMLMEFWDETAWIEEWDSASREEEELTVLPGAVKVSLQLIPREGERFPRVVQLTTPIRVTASTNSTESAESTSTTGGVQ